MTELRCRDVEEMLVDYLEGELREDQRTDVENHVRGCASCAVARSEFEGLREALRRDTTPDPGTAFWKSFPERVWQAYRAEAKDKAANELGARWSRVRTALESLMSAPRWVPVAAALLIAIGASYLALRAPVNELDAAAFQARIRSDINMATLAHDAANEVASPNQFGFAQADGSVTYFRLGWWYAESLAYSAGGDVETARARLAAIAAILRAAAPRLADSLGGEPSVRNIAAFEPQLLRVARSTGERDEALFRAGVWLENLALAAAAGDDHALHAAAPSLAVLGHDLERARIPPGAQRDFRELSGILAHTTLSVNDLAEVRRLVRRIQIILM